MAEIAPFRGILYSPNAGDPSKLLAPPYDVISDAERAQLATLDAHNVVRLILPEAADKKDPDARYAAAAEEWKRWLADGTLRRDEQPAIYRYHQVFEVYGKEVTRKGFVARVRLRPFSDGIIVPHERTLSGPKLDRLKLMRATHAHFSQIFGLYEDRYAEAADVFAEAELRKPDLEGHTADGVLHRLWRVTDREAQRRLARFMADRKVYIADGHHRYETMLALRDELRKDAASPASAVEYGVMFLCAMDDPGLVVLPTHRVLFGLPDFSVEDLLARAREFFKVLTGPMASPAMVRQALAGHGKRLPTIGVLVPGASDMIYLQIRGDLVRESVPGLEHKAIADLDVALLHVCLLERVLGISREAQEKQTNLRYVKDWDKAFDEARAPGVQAVLLLNPTLVSQVKAVADAGEVMPQKSTYFYPKIASGIVMNPIDAAETVELVDESAVDTIAPAPPAPAPAPTPVAAEKPAAVEATVEIGGAVAEAAGPAPDDKKPAATPAKKGKSKAKAAEDKGEPDDAG